VKTLREFEKEQEELRSRLFSMLFIISAFEDQLARLRAEREQLERRLADLPMEAEVSYWTRLMRLLRTGR
jgi:predicted nuclease with TOPRIM domain